MVKENFNECKPKIDQFAPARVLSGIAIGALNPEHKYAYKTCCYAVVARAIRDGQVRDADEIVLVGRESRVHHAFVVRDGEVVVDSLIKHGTYDDDVGTYKVSGMLDDRETLTRVAKITFAEFKQRFNVDTLVDISLGAEYPSPTCDV